MISISTVTWIFFSILFKYKYNKFITVSTLVTGVWILGLILTQTKNYPYIPVGIEIKIYTFTVTFIINFIYLIFHRRYNFAKPAAINVRKQEKLISLIFIISFLGLLPPFMNTLDLIASYGIDLKLIRDVNFLFIDQMYSSFGIIFVRVLPLTFLKLMLLFVITKTFSRRYEYVLTFILLMVSIFVYGGRMDFLLLVLFYLVDHIYTNSYSVKKISVRYLIYGFLFLMIITNLRDSNGTTFFTSIISYLGAPFSFLQYLIDNTLDTLIQKNGYLTFSFIIEPIALITKIFLRNIMTPSHLFNIVAQPFASIGVNSVRYYNNNTTSLFIWLWDFGKIGIVIGPIILVSLILFFEKRFKKRNNIYRYNMLIYFVAYSVMSSIEYPYLGISIFIVFSVLSSLERIK